MYSFTFLASLITKPSNIMTIVPLGLFPFVGWTDQAEDVEGPKGADKADQKQDEEEAKA